jgi:hypothetical protein
MIGMISPGFKNNLCAGIMHLDLIENFGISHCLVSKTKVKKKHELLILRLNSQNDGKRVCKDPGTGTE